MKCVLINIPAPGLPPATADIFEYPRGQGFRMGAPRRVGPWVFPERVVARQRLDAEEVEGRGIDMAGINRGNEIVIDHMFAARQIDDCGAFGQSGKVRGVDDVGGYRCDGQRVDQYICSGEKCRQLIRPVKAFHTRFGSGRSGPAGDVEAGIAQPPRDGKSQRAEPHHPDAAVHWPTGRRDEATRR